MKNRFHISIWTITLLLLLGACSKQPIDTPAEPQGKGNVRVDIKLPQESITTLTKTTISTPEENHISKLKVFVTPYSADHSQPIEMVLDIDPNTAFVSKNATWNNIAQSLSIKGLPDPETTRNIYVVANWTSEIAAGNSEQVLIAALSEISGSIAAPTPQSPLIMSGGVQNHSFKASSILNIDLKRQVAKIEVTLVLDGAFTKLFPDVVIGETTQLQVLGVPRQSYIIPNATMPTTSTLFNYQMQSGTVDAKQWKTTVYVYENLVSGNDYPTLKQRVTSLHLNMPYKLKDQDAVDNNHYLIPIETTDPTNPYAIRRNNLYRLRGTIKGFGGQEFINNIDIPTLTYASDWNL